MNIQKVIQISPRLWANIIDALELAVIEGENPVADQVLGEIQEAEDDE